MGWLHKLLPDQHTKDCLFVLRDLRGKWESEFAWQAVEQKVVAAIQDNPERIKTKILGDGSTPLDIVLTLIANVCLNEAGSGQNHVYRGRLSLIGNSFRALFHKAVEEQCDHGFISPDEKRHAIENLAEAIEGAG